mmetsp:Transcript_3650/g.12973  ORF Transcript_3650/g.12973 Transcript_3650/m.12973 type:complete len:290 (-) Transcript_3650:398-1267(-)
MSRVFDIKQTSHSTSHAMPTRSCSEQSLKKPVKRFLFPGNGSQQLLLPDPILQCQGLLARLLLEQIEILLNRRRHRLEQGFSSLAHVLVERLPEVKPGDVMLRSVWQEHLDPVGGVSMGNETVVQEELIIRPPSVVQADLCSPRDFNASDQAHVPILVHGIPSAPRRMVGQVKDRNQESLHPSCRLQLDRSRANQVMSVEEVLLRNPLPERVELRARQNSFCRRDGILPVLVPPEVYHIRLSLKGSVLQLHQLVLLPPAQHSWRGRKHSNVVTMYRPVSPRLLVQKAQS